MFLTQHSYGTAAAVDQTAAPPHPTFPATIGVLRAAGNAKGTVKKVSQMIKICLLFYIKNVQLTISRMFCSAANQAAAPPFHTLLSHDHDQQEKERRERERECKKNG
jgi:hypothetical protein